jgi:hypothetical protein
MFLGLGLVLRVSPKFIGNLWKSVVRASILYPCMPKCRVLSVVRCLLARRLTQSRKIRVISLADVRHLLCTLTAV